MIGRSGPRGRSPRGARATAAPIPKGPGRLSIRAAPGSARNVESLIRKGGCKPKAGHHPEECGLAKVVPPGVRREAVAHVVEADGVSQRRACKPLAVDRSGVRYRSVRPDRAEGRDQGCRSREASVWLLPHPHDAGTAMGSFLSGHRCAMPFRAVDEPEEARAAHSVRTRTKDVYCTKGFCPEMDHAPKRVQNQTDGSQQNQIFSRETSHQMAARRGMPHENFPV